MKKIYTAPTNKVIQINLEGKVANLIVGSNTGSQNLEDGWTNKKDFTYEEESEFPWASQE